MHPIDFKDANLELVSPENWDEKLYGFCGNLFIQRKDEVLRSCWRISIKEWMKLLFTRRIYLYVFDSKTQPPVRLSVD